MGRATDVLIDVVLKVLGVLTVRIVLVLKVLGVLAVPWKVHLC
jgi:hypothetical protein